MSVSNFFIAKQKFTDQLCSRIWTGNFCRGSGFKYKILLEVR